MLFRSNKNTAEFKLMEIATKMRNSIGAQRMYRKCTNKQQDKEEFKSIKLKCVELKTFEDSASERRLCANRSKQQRYRDRQKAKKQAAIEMGN